MPLIWHIFHQMHTSWKEEKTCWILLLLPTKGIIEAWIVLYFPERFDGWINISICKNSIWLNVQWKKWMMEWLLNIHLSSTVMPWFRSCFGFDKIEGLLSKYVLSDVFIYLFISSCCEQHYTRKILSKMQYSKIASCDMFDKRCKELQTYHICIINLH